MRRALPVTNANRCPWLWTRLEYASPFVIADDTIDRVRRQTGIVSLIGETVKLVRRGRSFVGLCPFHKEKTPSFHVNEERGFYHCFGCSVSGDAFKFVMETEGLSFIEAVRRLAERAGIEVEEDQNADDQRRRAEHRRRREELYDVSNVAAAYFERMLLEHPLAEFARAELERRGLATASATDTVADALQSFRVGYAPYGWAGLADHLRDSGLSARAAETVGLLVPRKSGGGHYDRFRHRLMFAVIDATGRVVGFSGRVLDEPAPEALRTAGIDALGTARSEPPAKYVNSPESPIYKKREVVFGLYQARQALRSENYCVVVEGNFDVVSLHARGIRHVVAPLGTAFTSEQAMMLKRYVPTVVLLFDGDAAGRRAVGAAREPCQEAGLITKVASLPDGQDPDDLVRSSGAESIRRLVGGAQGIVEHLIDAALDSGFALGDAQTQAAKLKEVVDILAATQDPAVRALAEQHADRIASRLGIEDARSFRALRGEVLKALRPGGPSRPTAERRRPRRPQDALGLAVFGAFLDYPELLTTQEAVAGAAWLSGDIAAAIAALRQTFDMGGLENPELVLAKLPPSIHPFAASRLAAPKHERLEHAQAELYENLEKLKRLELRRQNTEELEDLERAQKSGDFEQEMQLLREQMRRARKRHGLEER
ncbi:MAG: DNA primase [Polyangiaceae bacterium]